LSNEDWTALPDHIHHRTEALAPFLTAIGAALAEENEAPGPAVRPAQFCLT
jgi:hypothetical protein